MASVGRDDLLLQQLARGELQALGSLYDAYSRLVFHLLLAWGLDEAAAEDALQETFLALVDLGRAVTRIRNAEAYLVGVARHLARRSRRPSDLPPAEVCEAAVDEQALTERLTVRNAVARLPAEQAEVVVLKVWHGQTFAEIAAALGISPFTAASRYRYALDKLRTFLGENDDGRTGVGTPTECCRSGSAKHRTQKQSDKPRS